jgi:hypothetical protein
MRGKYFKRNKKSENAARSQQLQRDHLKLTGVGLAHQKHFFLRHQFVVQELRWILAVNSYRELLTRSTTACQLAKALHKDSSNVRPQA